MTDENKPSPEPAPAEQGEEPADPQDKASNDNWDKFDSMEDWADWNSTGLYNGLFCLTKWPKDKADAAIAQLDMIYEYTMRVMSRALAARPQPKEPQAEASGEGAYKFGYFPRAKYQDLVFYVKGDSGMNRQLFEMPDLPANRAMMDAILSTRLAAEAEVKALREALEWYADPDHWGEDDWGAMSVVCGIEYGTPGTIARAALDGSDTPLTDLHNAFPVEASGGCDGLEAALRQAEYYANQGIAYGDTNHVRILAKAYLDILSSRSAEKALRDALAKEHRDFVSFTTDPFVAGEGREEAMWAEHHRVNPGCPVCALLPHEAPKDGSGKA